MSIGTHIHTYKCTKDNMDYNVKSIGTRVLLKRVFFSGTHLGFAHILYKNRFLSS